ncbi:MAG TPA: hypothetical protein VFQ68_16095 [Streptosporangiaceae bacterium]|nr:hypothetical protein [Streptosporangiaceae bacterium]
MTLMGKLKGVAVVTAAVAGFHAWQAGAVTSAVTAALPGGTNLGTHTGWARALLAADRLPQTSCNVNAVLEWEAREGGGFGNQAAYNPLNVNPGPGAGWPGRNATGAWAFPDAATGLRYTVATLNNGYYGGVLAALRAGNDAQRVCDAIMASPWAASRYGGTLAASCSGAASSA